METTNVVLSTIALPAISPGLLQSAANSDSDLVALQKHREKLLEKADISSGSLVQAGCVSDISRTENVVDRDDYQDILRQMAQLMRGYNEELLDQLSLRAYVKVKNYDDSGIFETYCLGSRTGNIDIGDEADAIGYLAWLAR